MGNQGQRPSGWRLGAAARPPLSQGPTVCSGEAVSDTPGARKMPPRSQARAKPFSGLCSRWTPARLVNHSLPRPRRGFSEGDREANPQGECMEGLRKGCTLDGWGSRLGVGESGGWRSEIKMSVGLILSHFLSRLVRRPASPRRIKGSGAAGRGCKGIWDGGLGRLAGALWVVWDIELNCV